MNQKEINEKVFDMFTKNEEALEKKNPYYALEIDATAMYMADPKDFRAFLEVMGEGTEAYNAALRGKDTAIEVMKAQNHVYNAEKLYAEIFSVSNNLRIIDPRAHKDFGDLMMAKGGVAKAAFEAGTFKAERDLKYGVYREGSLERQDKKKDKDKGKDKGIDIVD